MADSRPTSLNVAHSLCELTSYNCHCSFKVRETHARLTFTYFPPSPCFFTSFGGEMILEGEEWQGWDETTGAASLLNWPEPNNVEIHLWINQNQTKWRYTLTQKFQIGKIGCDLCLWFQEDNRATTLVNQSEEVLEWTVFQFSVLKSRLVKLKLELWLKCLKIFWKES